MQKEFSETENLIGNKGISVLAHSKIIVFGLNGTGACVVEGLARCGIGQLTLVESELIKITDVNRNILALYSTIGKPKVQVAKERIRNIDSNILVHTYQTGYNSDTEKLFDILSYDYIIDAMEETSSKALLIENAKKYGIPILSVMDMTSKLSAAKLRIDDISKAGICGMAKELKKMLRKQKVGGVQVLFSKEIPRALNRGREKANGSIVYISAVSGMMAAEEVVKNLLKQKNKQ